MPNENLDELLDSSTPAGEDASEKPSTEPQFSEQKPARPSTEQQLGARIRKLEEASKAVFNELAAYKAQKPSSAVDSDLRQDLAVTRLVAQGYSEDEANFVLKAGGLENPFVKAGIESIRAKAKVGQAQPDASQVAAPVSSQDTPIHKMKPEEKSRAWREKLDKAVNKRAGQVV